MEISFIGLAPDQIFLKSSFNHPEVGRILVSFGTFPTHCTAKNYKGEHRYMTDGDSVIEPT